MDLHHFQNKRSIYFYLSTRDFQMLQYRRVASDAHRKSSLSTLTSFPSKIFKNERKKCVLFIKTIITEVLQV